MNDKKMNESSPVPPPSFFSTIFSFVCDKNDKHNKNVMTDYMVWYSIRMHYYALMTIITTSTIV